jgi:hypothetical protein
MNLLHKVRILAGAVAHMPFMPRPERDCLEGSEEKTGAPNRTDLERKTEEAGTDRVADLIAEKQRRAQD